ncbi:DUF2997 domain-containing protein [Vulcanococcus sp. Clear-D1]|jgi:hypothetical protein|uniref:DUF2997 domain-containing protein n=1 Tax=Vulcanococcus sp. Clear-D1 TaxID=2766970 RepID=UPI00199D6457|nr:DUF2997 domain-containing protein [Vulcanococcus sp. Clear-D1]MBD1192887.1 DUF2997 domain-containing protein [Vulcanococcus sp. Clear-D1]
MAQQTIRFRIRPDGRVEELVEGITGSGCEQLTERIEARLGSVQQRQATSEAFQASNAAVTPEQTQTLSSPVS